jgi:hypothetical protein
MVTQAPENLTDYAVFEIFRFVAAFIFGGYFSKH